MQPDDVTKLIETAMPDAQVTVNSDGSHYEILVVSSAFEGLSRLRREQQINALLADAITSGVIHAVSNRLYTPMEWDKASKLQVS